MDSTTLNTFIQYGALGIITYYYVKNSNKTANSIHSEYEKLIDNLISTQNETLKDLKTAIEKLTEYIISNK